MAKRIADSELRRLALPGAQAKLKALQAEVAALLETFPELRRGRSARATQDAADSTPGSTRRRRKPGRKTPMTAAERKAVSERMRKYWAEKRAAKK